MNKIGNGAKISKVQLNIAKIRKIKKITTNIMIAQKKTVLSHKNKIPIQN